MAICSDNIDSGQSFKNVYSTERAHVKNYYYYI